jgi:hypothetical protein
MLRVLLRVLLRVQQATRILLVEIFSEVTPNSLWSYESVVSHVIASHL